MTTTAPRMTHAEWREIGRARFGTDPMDWRFRCCSCGTEYGPADFQALGADPRRAPGECIGRVHTEQHAQGLRDRDPATAGCEWLARGAERGVGVVEVVFLGGAVFAMPFADSPQEGMPTS